MESATQVQILFKADCILLYANTFEKGMIPSIPTHHLRVNSKTDCAQ